MSRSTLLDKAKVRARAFELGIHSQHHFEIAYCNKFKKEGEHRAPKHAWNGKKLALKGAQEIADLLKIDSYFELEPDKFISPWAEFIQKQQDHESFSEIVFVNHDSNINGMLNFDKLLTINHLQKVNIHHHFHFQLVGDIGDSFVIFMSSASQTIQLAPISTPNDEMNNQFYNPNIRYPKFNFSFDENDDTGWKKIIIIKGKSIPIIIKDIPNLSLSANELNTLAIRLQELEVAVNCHEFVVVNG